MLFLYLMAVEMARMPMGATGLTFREGAALTAALRQHRRPGHGRQALPYPGSSRWSLRDATLSLSPPDTL